MSKREMNLNWPLTPQEELQLEEAVQFFKIMISGSINMDTMLYLSEWPKLDSCAVILKSLQSIGWHAGNCAHALARMGVKSFISGAIGNDDKGNVIVEELTKQGYDTRFLEMKENATTGTACIPVYLDKHHMFLHRGANDLGDLDPVEQARSIAAKLVLIFDPSAASMGKIRKTLLDKTRDEKIVWAPGAINMDRDNLKQILPLIDMLIVNYIEYKIIKEKLGEYHYMMDGLALVVTLGKKGSCSRLNDVWEFAPAFDCNPIDCIGAGDAFIGAYLLAQHAKLSPKQCLLVGNRSGAFAVQAAGARTNLTDLSQFFRDETISVAEASLQDVLTMNNEYMDIINNAI